MTRLYNWKSEKIKRRVLRNNMSKAEQILWQRLRKRQINGKRFLRQFSVEKYVVDFYCQELKLAIEVDGNTHNTLEEIEQDKVRQKRIEIYGIEFIRFRNEEIFSDIENVLDKIKKRILEIS
ncbi:MAG TPA: endonuclease domain-containing protein [Ignavibacteria bacterium]|nr:endonuclease domain-containing protein [Ignavibacteria bacterium]HRB00640.1 endonuclease domain-containing protein [Ignavibacteria bacterium]